jgi:hypothetical protein
MSSEEQQTNEDVVGKYKRLLSMARSSLEANQATLAEKDKYIIQLKSALEEEKLARTNKKSSIGKDDENLITRAILRRVDVEDRIWILIEYEGNNYDDRWISFGSEEDLNDYVQRIPGVPLEMPNKSLTPAEAYQIVSLILSISF